MSDSEEEAANEDAQQEGPPPLVDPYTDPLGSPRIRGPGNSLPGSGQMLLGDAKKCKEVGLGAYKVNDYSKAIECWKSAYEQLKLLRKEMLYKEDQPEYAEASNLSVVLCLNLAQVHLKQGNFCQASEFCDTVLGQDPHNAKALYRKASAQLMASDIKGARSTANEWLQHDPDNAEARQLLSKIVREGKGSKAAAQEAAKRMFGGIEHDPRTENPPPKPNTDTLNEFDDWVDEEASGLKKNSDGTYTLESGPPERPRSAFTDEQWRSFFRTIFFCCRKREKSKSD
mmetsp:Transcript_143748/g.265104  ORF Transcript_143748/g.265104 Transcript_143748/m.265104 type:complete len:285 (+) Transcript_143748:49-903(+)